MKQAYSVAAIKPFWRWAVTLEERPDIPAVPFYTKAAALVLADESAARFPERTTVLLRRVFLAGEVEIIPHRL